MVNEKILSTLRGLVAGFVVLAAVSFLPGETPGTVEGILLGVDGRPAEGFQVLLISGAGEPVSVSSLDREGTYRFDQVAPGEYGLGVRSPEGLAAPALLAPFQVQERTVRRDLRLRRAVSSVEISPAAGGVGIWWAGLSPAAKVWTVTGGLVAAGLAYSLIDDDTPRANGEGPATPSLPF